MGLRRQGSQTLDPSVFGRPFTPSPLPGGERSRDAEGGPGEGFGIASGHEQPLSRPRIKSGAGCASRESTSPQRGEVSQNNLPCDFASTDGALNIAGFTLGITGRLPAKSSASVMSWMRGTGAHTPESSKPHVYI